MGQSLALPEFVLNFTFVAPFRNIAEVVFVCWSENLRKVVNKVVVPTGFEDLDIVVVDLSDCNNTLPVPLIALAAYRPSVGRKSENSLSIFLATAYTFSRYRQ